MQLTTLILLVSGMRDVPIEQPLMVDAGRRRVCHSVFLNSQWRQPVACSTGAHCRPGRIGDSGVPSCTVFCCNEDLPTRLCQRRPSCSPLPASSQDKLTIHDVHSCTISNKACWPERGRLTAATMVPLLHGVAVYKLACFLTKTPETAFKPEKAAGAEHRCNIEERQKEKFWHCS